MHQLAITLKNKGYIITGSDDEIYNPSRSTLKEHNLLPKKMGWHPNKINSSLDCVILGMHARKDNPELLKAKELGIKIYSYPHFIAEYAEKKKRVVIAGSHGKTSITAAIMHVLKYWQKDFDFLVGARLKGFEGSVKLTDAPIIIMEGDEYLSSPIHPAPKIHYYYPQLALLSGIAWDHMNVFPSFEFYKNQFEKFLDLMPINSTLIYNYEDKNVNEIVQNTKHINTKLYGTPDFNQEAGVCNILVDKKHIPLKIFGKHNMQNLMGAQKVCEELGISKKRFFKAIQSFEGASKRLDVLKKTKNNSIYRDFAHAPSKVKATTDAVKSAYPKRKLLAVFELHTYSSLNKKFLPQYKSTMQAADKAVVFFNEHSLKIKKLPALSIKDVKDAFKRKDLVVLNSKEELATFLQKQNWDNYNLLMMSSGTFGGLENKDIVNFVV